MSTLLFDAGIMQLLVIRMRPVPSPRAASMLMHAVRCIERKMHVVAYVV